MTHAVLIVEDETTFAKNVAVYLSRYDYEVCRAESAEEGLEQLTAFRPKVILLDFNLPGMNGLEMMEELRRRDSQARVIIVTGHSSGRIVVNAMKAGAFDYLTKPVSLSKIRLVLEKATCLE